MTNISKIFFANIIIAVAIITSVIFYSCGQKTDLSQFPTNTGSPVIGDTVYVQQSPVWTGFNQPQAILLGREPLVYVCDTKNDRVVQMELSGTIIGALTVKNPVAVAQDYNFDLLVIGDSVLPVINDTINVVYRIKLVEVGGIISNASLLPMLGSDFPTPLTSRQRKFTGVGVFAGNEYIVTRVGPNNTSSLDPDNALLRVPTSEPVTAVTVLSGFQATGNGVYSIDYNSAVTTFDNNLTEFIITRNSPDFGFKINWFIYDDINGAYLPKFVPEDNVDILNKQLDTPVGICVDASRNVFVVDNTKDSLYKYTSTGRLTNQSFGGTGSGDNQFNNPMGVSWNNKVLYIADTGNNRIVRFKLSTDLN